MTNIVRTPVRAARKGLLRIAGTLNPGETTTVSYRVRVLPHNERGNDDLVNFVLDPGQASPNDCLTGNERCTDNPVTETPVTEPRDDRDNSGWLPNTGGPELILLVLGAVLTLTGGGPVFSRLARR